MSMMPALISHLLADTAVAALVSTRIYPERLPESTSATPNTMPLITCEMVDEPVRTTHSNNQTFKARARVDAWGGSYKSAHAVADAIHAALQGYAGNMGNGSVIVGGVFRQAKRDASEPDVSLFRVSQEYLINWKEA